MLLEVPTFQSINLIKQRSAYRPVNDPSGPSSEPFLSRIKAQAGPLGLHVAVTGYFFSRALCCVPLKYKLFN